MMGPAMMASKVPMMGPADGRLHVASSVVSIMSRRRFIIPGRRTSTPWTTS